MSKIADIAAALVSVLNAHSFAMSFTAERRYLPPRFDATELTNLHVLVVPRSLQRDQETRSNLRREHGVDIGLMQRIDATDVDACDGLMALAEAIADHVSAEAQRVLELSDGSGAAWLRTESDPIYNPTVLDKHNVFLSIITPSYQLVG